MRTISTKIKDFAVGDQFIHYGCVFTVTGELEVWTNHGGKVDSRPTYGRSCKFVRYDTLSSQSNIDGLIRSYDWMQGVEEVTYAKIV